jgi:hypothetical protein
MNVALCFCVRNCAEFLKDIFSNIERVKTLNINVYTIFVYDNCTDDSEHLLEEYKKNNNNVILRNIINESEFRTERIAKARNECLNIIYNELGNIKYHMMIDADNVCIRTWNVDVLNNYLNNFDNDNWDCISFNNDDYYDIWALMFDNFRHHCWGFSEGGGWDGAVVLLKKYIRFRLDTLQENSMEVLSAFNGICLYKTENFKGFYYDGLYSNFKKIITEEELTNTVNEFKKYNLDVKLDHSWVECCEHLFYHVSAFKKGLKIKISKFKIM